MFTPDQKLTALSKYLIRLASGESIFSDETMCFENLRGSDGLDLNKLRNDIQLWKECITEA